MKLKKKLLILTIILVIIISIGLTVWFFWFRIKSDKPEELVEVYIEPSIAGAIAGAINSFKEGEFTEYCNYFVDMDEADSVSRDDTLRVYRTIIDYVEYAIISETVDGETTTIGVNVKKLDIKKLSEFPEVKNLEITSEYDLEDINVMGNAVNKIKDIIERNKYTIKKDMTVEKAYEIELIKLEGKWKIKGAENFRNAFIFDALLINIFQDTSNVQEEVDSITSYHNNLFNKEWEEYRGKQSGDNARMLISKLISQIDENKNDSKKLPTVIYNANSEEKVIEGGEIAFNNIKSYSQELTELRTKIATRHNHTIEFKYDNGLIAQIIIKY